LGYLQLVWNILLFYPLSAALHSRKRQNFWNLTLVEDIPDIQHGLLKEPIHLPTNIKTSDSPEPVLLTWIFIFCSMFSDVCIEYTSGFIEENPTTIRSRPQPSTYYRKLSTQSIQQQKQNWKKKRNEFDPLLDPFLK
jgi:hypothetical protein